jgi:magnesium-transporting ATPase (P-type)
LINVSVVKQFANKCYRTLLVAYVDYDVNEWETLKRNNNNFENETDRETVENNLVLVGIFGLMDPLRPGIKDAIAQCQKSGINVRMVTGDNIDTAIAISREAGIISDSDLLHNEQGYLCMTGKNFREMVGGLTTIHD